MSRSLRKPISSIARRGLAECNYRNSTGLSQVSIRHGYWGHVVHVRMRQQMVFDFIGGHLFAATIDLIFRAPFHHQMTGR